MDEEKEKEFKRIIKNCRAADDETSGSAAIAPGAKESVACAVLKDITDSLENSEMSGIIFFSLMSVPASIRRISATSQMI